jgi:hypothetical protein
MQSAPHQHNYNHSTSQGRSFTDDGRPMSPCCLQLPAQRNGLTPPHPTDTSRPAPCAPPVTLVWIFTVRFTHRPLDSKPNSTTGQHLSMICTLVMALTKTEMALTNRCSKNVVNNERVRAALPPSSTFWRPTKPSLALIIALGCAIGGYK